MPLPTFNVQRSTFNVRCLTFRFSLALCLGAIVLSSGCAGYQLRRDGAPTSIQILPVVNETSVPLLTEIVTPAVRRIIQQGAGFRLATQEPGEIELRVVLTKFERESLSSQRNDILATRDFALALTAQITATDRRSGRVMFEGPVIGRTTVRVGSDLVSAERQAMPVLAEDLARRLTSRLTDGGW